jgi:hypothetical protein
MKNIPGSCAPNKRKQKSPLTGSGNRTFGEPHSTPLDRFFDASHRENANFREKKNFSNQDGYSRQTKFESGTNLESDQEFSTNVKQMWTQNG